MGRCLTIRAAVCVACMLSTTQAVAADLYWNGIGSSGSAGGGTGTWNTTNTNWETLATGGIPAAWASGDNGTFGGTAGTVTLASSLTTGTLFATINGYTLSTSNASTLQSTGVDVASSGTFTLGVVLTGTGAFTKSGAGQLTTTARNTLDGPITVAAGTLRLNDARDMNGTATVGSGATLTVESNGNGGYYQPDALLLDNATVTSVVAAGNRYHGIYTTVVTASSGASSIGTPLFMNKTGAGTPQSMTVTVGSGASLAISGSINNHPDQIGTAASLTKAGAGTLSLTGANGFTGNMLIGSGTVQDGYQAAVNSPTVSGLGNMMVAGRTVTTSTGATLVFTTSDAIGNYNILISSTLVADGGTITRTGGAFNSIGSIGLRNGGRLTSQNGQNATVNSFALNGSVVVSGTSPSFIDTAGSSNNGIHLGTAGSTNVFDVADVTGNANADLTVSAPLVNAVFGAAAGLTKTGAGTLLMTGGNTFSGNMTINAGTVAPDLTVNSTSPSATALGNMTTSGRTITISSGATLRFDAPDAIGQYNYATPVTLIADGGTITREASANTFNSVGNITLRNGGRVTTTNGNASTVGSFAFNGSVTVDGTSGSFIDTLAGQSTNSYINLGTVGGSTTFDVAATGDSAADLTVSAILGDKVLSGAAGLVKAGAGRMRVTSANAYSGGTTIRSGTIVAANSSALGTAGTVTLNDASTGSGNAGLLVDAGGGSVTISRPITVANQGTGVATLGSGSLAGANQAVFSGAITLAKDVTLAGAAGGDRTQFSGGIGGTGGVTVSTPSTGRIVFLTSANTFSGGLSLTSNSNLQLGEGAGTSTSFIPDTASVTIASGAFLKLAKGGNAEAIDALLGAGTVQAVAGADTLTVGSSGGSGTFSGVLANGGATLSFTKTGTGTQVLSGNNTYTGATSVLQGVLRVDGSLSSSSNLSVAAAAWLMGTGTVAGTATINGTLSPGASPGIATFGGLILSSTSTTAIEIASAGTRGTDFDGVSILNSAGLTYGGTLAFAFGGSAIPDTSTFDIFSFTGGATGSFASVTSTGFYSGSWTNNNDGTFSLAKDGQTVTFSQTTGDVIVVPEPVGLTFAGLGMIAVLRIATAFARRCRDRHDT